MPIGGFVINIDSARKEEVLQSLGKYREVEVFGADDDGNVVAVLDTETAAAMEDLTIRLQREEGILSLGITYFDAEDELEQIDKGLLQPTFSFGRKSEKP